VLKKDSNDSDERKLCAETTTAPLEENQSRMPQPLLAAGKRRRRVQEATDTALQGVSRECSVFSIVGCGGGLLKDSRAVRNVKDEKFQVEAKSKDKLRFDD
jgi:hypothetical protein